MTIEFLRIAASSVARTEIGNSIGVLRDGILRFTLVYPSAVTVDQERRRLQDLLSADGFELFPLPGGQDPAVLVLQFPGISRLQSASFLSATAQDLVDALDLSGCSPDIDPPWHPIDERDAAAESVSGLIGAFCNSDAAPPNDPRWAVKMIRAEEAWTKFGTRGEHVLVGQPDTGVTDHRELDSAIDLAKGHDFVGGSASPIDPLSSSMSSPGHGTATSSVVASRETRSIVGSAPGATIVPVRCVDSVVLSSGAAVAAAVDHARLKGCSVITMSLGGPWEYPELKRAVSRAVADGLVVLAAAGNCVGFVVYPAWDENVIAVAGVDIDRRRWKGSSHGSAVDIAAPAENVHVARRRGPTDIDKTLVEPGQGTSFAVALTAGAAAVWISRHDHTKLRHIARDRNTTVQELFRACLKQSASRPPNWDTAEMGAGVVDMVALLAVDPKSVPLTLKPSGNPIASLFAATPSNERYVAEAAYLATDRMRRRDPTLVHLVESAVPPRPSRQCRTAISGNQALERDLLDAAFGVGPITPYIGPRPALKMIAAAAGGTVEATEAITESMARDRLAGDGGRRILETLDRTFGAIDAARDPDPAIAAARQRVLNAAPEVLDGLVRGAHDLLDFRGIHGVALEALVSLTGRPSIRLRDALPNLFDPDDPRLENWASDFLMNRTSLSKLFRATGRIDIERDGEWVHVGTGTVVGDGLILTNRHVAEAFCEPFPTPGNGRTYRLVERASIAFDCEASDPRARFALDQVVSIGASRIGAFADVTKLDAALLSVATDNAHGGNLPKPPAPRELPASGRVVVVGYPAKPGLDAGIDPATGKTSLEAWDRLALLYQNDFGKKYASPGFVKLPTGGVAGDPHGWVFTHDATTLGGNSGSQVASLESFGICGLHFGGQVLRQNLAHGLDAVCDALASHADLVDGEVWRL